MKPANEGLIEFNIISFDKEKEVKGINDKHAGSQLSKILFGENMEIKTEEFELRENDTCVSKDGNIISMPKNSYKKCARNKQYREKGLPTASYYYVDSIEELEKSKKDRKVKEVKIVDLANYIKAKEREERNIG